MYPWNDTIDSPQNVVHTQVIDSLKGELHNNRCVLSTLEVRLARAEALATTSTLTSSMLVPRETDVGYALESRNLELMMSEAEMLNSNKKDHRVKTQKEGDAGIGRVEHEAWVKERKAPQKSAAAEHRLTELDASEESAQGQKANPSHGIDVEIKSSRRDNAVRGGNGTNLANFNSRYTLTN